MVCFSKKTLMYYVCNLARLLYFGCFYFGIANHVFCYLDRILANIAFTQRGECFHSC